MSRAAAVSSAHVILHCIGHPAVHLPLLGIHGSSIICHHVMVRGQSAPLRADQLRGTTAATDQTSCGDIDHENMMEVKLYWGCWKDDEEV